MAHIYNVGLRFFASVPFKRKIMKARKLKEILNNTRYTVAFYGDYVGIGSPLCHDLIKLEVETNKITYALDAFHKGRSAIGSPELEFIWDKLHEMVDNGGITEIVNGNDIIENPLPVYTVRHGALICTVTDAYGWPNVTVEGYMMHDNTYFKTAPEAIEYGIDEFEARLGYLTQHRKEAIERKREIEANISHCKEVIQGLKLLTPLKGERINTMTTDPNIKQEEVKEPAEQVTEIEQVPGEEKESEEG